MNTNVVRLLIALLRSTVFNKNLSDYERSLYTDEILPELIRIGKRHNIAHLVVLGLQKNQFLTKSYPNIDSIVFKEVYRSEQYKFELENLAHALEKTGTPFIPLKGSVMNQYYPEAWMRTSCDIDILVHSETMQKVVDYLVDTCNYTINHITSHDISLLTPTKVTVELHYELIEKDTVKSSSNILKKVWDSSVLHKGFRFWYEMSDDMFYFYHIAHMAKHFELGGCGIRSIIDLWLLNNKKTGNKQKRDILLAQGDLKHFADTVTQLSEIWFDNKPYSSIAKQLESFIVCGGAFGTVESNVVLQQQKSGGKLKYIISRVFLPYDVIKYQYPILMRYKCLTPFWEIIRWTKCFSTDKRKKALRELKQNHTVTDSEFTNIQAFLKNVGL